MTLFFPSQAGVCHNNVCQKSVYVCHDGSWRLGGLEHACKFTEATPSFLQSCLAFRYEEGLAPEEKVISEEKTKQKFEPLLWNTMRIIFSHSSKFLQ